MNDTLQAGLAWFGGASALGYLGFGIWLSVASVFEHRRLEAERTELRARRAPITESDIAAVDFDTEIFELLKGDQQ
jgi:hypothetical protein